MRFESLRHVLSTPGWRRSMLLRRSGASLLLAGALALALLDSLAQEPQALVFERALAAGETASEQDVALVDVPAHLVPATALINPSDVDGQVVVAAAAVGEVATKDRFLDPSGAHFSTGEITHLVPLRLAEPEVIPLLHHGDTVTIVSQAPEDGSTQVIATGGRIILASAQEQPGTLLIALPAHAASEVAAASLNTALAVVLTGERATGS
ncbi:SAF domain-containing protein [Corynebacterium alimapuense]|uniref:SAF domain-containing protein n=1 Tax=Corynebacterium alimapuense TaxID=1576874 RepID=A0A3M8K5W8_9CORY|nr:SAF domain-containing protein [Corynebacterium alimapuense]RNE48601.1 hypothetical protein C5L39_08930 [Corynebacterium alimapuense]